MSTRDPAALGAAAWARRYASAKLRREVDALQRLQIPVVVLEPGRELTDLMGFDFMNHDKTKQIVGASILDAGEQLRQPLVRTLVEGLAAARTQSQSSIPDRKRSDPVPRASSATR
jgi:hypothetical protein